MVAIYETGSIQKRINAFKRPVPTLTQRINNVNSIKMHIRSYVFTSALRPFHFIPPCRRGEFDFTSVFQSIFVTSRLFTIDFRGALKTAAQVTSSLQSGFYEMAVVFWSLFTLFWLLKALALYACIEAEVEKSSSYRCRRSLPMFLAELDAPTC